MSLGLDFSLLVAGRVPPDVHLCDLAPDRHVRFFIARRAVQQRQTGTDRSGSDLFPYPAGSILPRDTVRHSWMVTVRLI